MLTWPFKKNIAHYVSLVDPNVYFSSCIGYTKNKIKYSLDFKNRKGDFMNIVDALIILIILASGVAGFKRGVLKQTVSTVGFIIVVVLAFYLKNPIAEFLSLHFPFFKFSGSFANVTSLNIILYQIISFILVVL